MYKKRVTFGAAILVVGLTLADQAGSSLINLENADPPGLTISQAFGPDGGSAGQDKTAQSGTDADLGFDASQVNETVILAAPGEVLMPVLTPDTTSFDHLGTGGNVVLFDQFLVQHDPCSPGSGGVPAGCVTADGDTFAVSHLEPDAYTLQISEIAPASGLRGVQYSGEYSIPEPGSLSLLGAGLLGLGAILRRRHKSKVK